MKFTENHFVWIVCGLGIAVFFGAVLTGAVAVTREHCLSGLIGGAIGLAFGLVYQRFWGKNKTEKN